MRPLATPKVMAGEQIGSYRIVRQLGAGRWGAVFEGTHEYIGRRAAVRILSADLARGPTLSEQLLQVLLAVQMVRHPGFVHVLEFDRLVDGGAYIVMDYVDGETLARRLGRSSAPQAMSDALRLAWQLAEALAAAHASDVHHGDLTPDSIILLAAADAAAGEYAKILDLGLAQLAEVQALMCQHAMEQLGVPTGTALYLAPERWRQDRAPAAAADVYSLGAIIYHMLTGRPPFVASSASELMTLHVVAEPAAIHERCPQLAGELAGLVHQMLDKEPGARPSMLRVAHGLRRLVGGELTSAIPQSYSSMRADFPLAQPAELRAPLSAPSAATGASMSTPDWDVIGPTAAAPTAMPSSRVGAGPSAAASLVKHVIGFLSGGEDESTPPDPEVALSELDHGCFGLDAPRRMTVERPVKVTAAAVRDRMQRALVQASAEHGAPQLIDTQLGQLVRVELIPDSPEEFTVTPLSEREQPVLRAELTQWEWLVTPRQAGPRKRLRVRATNLVDVGGKRLTKSHPVRTLEVDVMVDAGSAAPSEQVNTAAVRRLLDAVLPSDSTLEAFCLDYFPRVLLRFGGGMERLQKVTLLLSAVPPAQVLSRLRDAEPELLEMLQARLAPPAPPAPLAPVTFVANEPALLAEQPRAARGPELGRETDEPVPPTPPPPRRRSQIRRRWGRRLVGALLLVALGAGLHRCSAHLSLAHQVKSP